MKKNGKILGLSLALWVIAVIGAACVSENVVYTIEYDANGGIGATASSTHEKGVVQELTPNGFTREGYVFTGWATRSNGSGLGFTDKQAVVDMSTRNGDVVTLYAQWRFEGYTVSYNANGGTGTMEPSEHRSGAAKPLSENAFLRPAYAFTGWNTKGDGSGDSFTDKQSVTDLAESGDFRLYAQWALTGYLVTYDANGGTGTTAGSAHDKDVAKALTENAFIRAGYTFTGWNTESDGAGDGFTDKQSVTNPFAEPGAVTLYAQWRANTYTVTFDANGGTGAMAPSNHTFDVEAALPGNAFSYAGYAFAGWNSKADGSGDGFTDKQPVKDLTDKDGESIGLYAQWSVPVAAVSGGWYHSAALDTNGDIWAWGRNQYGQLGNGATTNSSVPVKVTAAAKFTAVETGDAHTLALDTGGNLWTWGYNYNGQLGIGSSGNPSESRSSPVKITTGVVFTQISAVAFFNLALDASGNIWSWGSNIYGQVVNDTGYANIFIPIQTSTGIVFTQISAGGSHSLAIDADGKLYAWGRNNYGQAGRAASTTPAVAAQIITGSTFKHISAGSYHSFAIDTDGSLWGWGTGVYGLFGDGTSPATRGTPAVIADARFETIDTGGYHSLAVDASGNVWTWGNNEYGQLGDGRSGGGAANRNRPYQVTDGVKAAFVSAGEYHSLFIDANGILWSYGYNLHGQLGDGTIGDKAFKTVPVTVRFKIGG